MKPDLYLFSSEFPYGKGEIFLQREIEILVEDFNVILIPNHVKKYKKEIPTEVNLDIRYAKYFSLYPIRLFEVLFSVEFYRITLKNLSRIKSLGHFFKQVYGGIVFKNWISKNIPENSLLYTYWSNYRTHGFYLAKRKKSFITVSRAHGYDVYEESLKKNEFWLDRGFSLSAMNLVVCISEDGKVYFQEKYNLTNLIVSKLGIDGAKEMVSLNDKKLVIVSCSLVIPRKRLELIHDSLLAYTDKFKQPIEWHHLGDGPSFNQIKQRVKNSPSQYLNVNFHGFVENKKILQLYKTIQPSIFINLSDFEGIPVSIMEAQSAGIPCIARDVGGMREIINQNNGFLLPNKCSATQVVDGIADIFSELKIRSENSRLSFEKQYNADKNYHEFNQILLNQIQ